MTIVSKTVDAKYRQQKGQDDAGRMIPGFVCDFGVDVSSAINSFQQGRTGAGG
jgi:hypothetical protein